MAKNRTEGDAHHYIPKFYLKRWAGSDRRLCEFTKPYNAVRDRMVFPGGTGYLHGLYKFDTRPPDDVNFMEKKFFQTVDNDANAALEQLLALNDNLTVPIKHAWARFLMSLFHRNPEEINRSRQFVLNELPAALDDPLGAYASLRRPGDPATFEEYRAAVPKLDTDRATIMLLRNIMDSNAVGAVLCGMRWTIIKLNNSPNPLLTCDNPLMRTDGIGHEHDCMVLLISPDSLFVAANNQRTIDSFVEIIRMPDSAVIINDIIVRQAVRYVYGTDESQLQFVADWLGERYASNSLG
jgi:hypothetical protein